MVPSRSTGTFSGNYYALRERHKAMPDHSRPWELTKRRIGTPWYGAGNWNFSWKLHVLLKAMGNLLFKTSGTDRKNSTRTKTINSSLITVLYTIRTKELAYALNPRKSLFCVISREIWLEKMFHIKKTKNLNREQWLRDKKKNDRNNGAFVSNALSCEVFCW